MRDLVNVLHVCAPARYGGLERVVQALAVGWQRAGSAVHVLAILDQGQPEHPFVSALRRSGVSVVAMELPARAYLKERRAVAAICAKLRPDLVHTHGARVDVVDSGMVRRIGLPTVTTVHGFTGGGWKNRFYELLQRRAFRSMTRVVAVSRVQLQSLAAQGVPKDRLEHIPNAWDGHLPSLDRSAARAALGVGDDTFLIGWVGRVGLEKGIDVMLEAVPRLPRDVTVAVLGDGSWKAAGERKVLSLGVGGQVTWHGAVPDAGRLFPAFDCFVLSSRTEGVPIVLFEAMAANVPVIATAVGGVPDVVSTAEALLVPPEDPAALAVAVAAVRQDSGAAAARARAARARLEREFSLDSWLERYQAVYRAAVEQGRGRSAE